MTLKNRVIALERKLDDTLGQRTVVIQVPSFEPGPDAELSGPDRIIVRDSRGNQRVLSGLREFYTITVQDPGLEMTDGNQDPLGRTGT